MLYEVRNFHKLTTRFCKVKLVNNTCAVIFSLLRILIMIILTVRFDIQQVFVPIQAGNVLSLVCCLLPVLGTSPFYLQLFHQ